MKKILLGLSIVLTVIFTGCGGGGGGDSDTTTPPATPPATKTIVMEVNSTYLLLAGDYITNTLDANMTIETDNNATTAKLNDGNATCTTTDIDNGCKKQ